MKAQLTWCIGVLAVLLACGSANAQTTPATTPVDKSPTNLIDAASQYKASSNQLLAIQQDTIKNAEKQLEQLRSLVTEGLVAKVELEAAEQKLATLHAELESTQKQIADTDNTIAEIRAEQELAKTAKANPVKLVSKQYGAFNTTATILRYSGLRSWSLGGIGGIQSFFSATFGRSLPTSAVGQSATHNRLGYDHRHAVDVALHPDSSEGRALITYLQSQGIPFLAFRGAIPGVATGPHIHIGSPSHRLSG